MARISRTRWIMPSEKSQWGPNRIISEFPRDHEEIRKAVHNIIVERPNQTFYEMFGTMTSPQDKEGLNQAYRIMREFIDKQ